MNGTYVAAWLDDYTSNIIYKEFQKFPKNEFKYHITIMYDVNTPCEKILTFKLPSSATFVFRDLKVISGSDNKKYLISEVDSTFIDNQYKDLVKLGYKHSYKELMKHITIAEVSEDFKLDFKNPLYGLVLNLDYIRLEPLILK